MKKTCLLIIILFIGQAYAEKSNPTQEAMKGPLDSLAHYYRT